MVMSASEKVLELASLHRKEAKLYERRGMESEAKLLRSIADDYARLVKGGGSDWVDIDHAQAAKGWSSRWWRQRCKDLKREGLARKRSGRWEIRRTALSEVPRKRSGQDEIVIPDGDIRELAEQLARD